MGKLADAVGHALRGVRPGPGHAILALPEFAAVPLSIVVTSSAFINEGNLPVRYTADGVGVSPPLAWTQVPAGAVALVLVVEDVDSPTPAPLVHAIAVNLPGGDGGLAEGALSDKKTDERGGVVKPEGGSKLDMGRNSFLGTTYLAPAPVQGHGPHRYMFQLFAVSAPLALAPNPGRGALVDAMKGRVIARGSLTGIYERA